jgi:hypothetical protein
VVLGWLVCVGLHAGFLRRTRWWDVGGGGERLDEVDWDVVL